MAKIIVTQALVDTLTMLRKQKGTKSKDLANHIGKTPGYITRLEKQELKTIDINILDSIFSFILGDDYQSTAIWERVYANLQIKLTKEEIENEVWFSNYDTVYRYIPVPTSLIDYFNDKIALLNISREYLLDRINANEAIPQEEINDSKILSNRWYYSTLKNCTFIKIQMDALSLDNILDKKIISSPYVYIYCIMFYLLKIEHVGKTVEIDRPTERQLQLSAKNILNEHKFYSIVEKENIINSEKTKEEIQNLLSSFDNENNKLISEILNEFKFASELDIRITNERLTKFLENLSSDIWFTLKIVSLNYNLLESIDFTQKKGFIEDIERLIKQYSDSQKSLKNSETY